MDITPGAARTATTFNLGPIITALGPYASLAIFYVDFGDGTGFGSSGNPQALGSFPTSHVYVNPGTYTVTGYASIEGRTESTSVSITIAPPAEKPAAATATDTWETTAAPSPQAVVPVTAIGLGSALSVGTAVSEIVERNAKAAARTEIKAPQVTVNVGTTTLVNIPSLPVGSTVKAQVKIGKTWTTLPATATANSTKSRPVALVWNASGVNTATSESVMAMTANAISSMPLNAAFIGVRPFSMCRWMFSSTTMASSTTTPMASTSASMVRMLME